MKHKTTFFSKNSRKFFNSYNSRQALVTGNFNELVYFVTSEIDDCSGATRKYTVRVLNLETGSVTKVSEFQQYANRRQAWKALKVLAANSVNSIVTVQF